MKKLLATTAVALVAMASAASAQSVLERVLGQIDNATNLASVNGTFANIAENIGSATAVTTYTKGETTYTQEAYRDYVASNTTVATYPSIESARVYYDPVNLTVIDAATFAGLSATNKARYTVVADGSTVFQSADGSLKIVTDEVAEAEARAAAVSGFTETIAYTGPAEGINGSINNTLIGIEQATQQAIASAGVSAIEWNMPTFDFGDMATTALGAVNTGEITLGVNSAVDNAKTSSTEALSSVMTQLGCSADTGAIVLNIASNMTGINGSITNTMSQLNGSMGNLSTTALGAVNTGEIISGVNAAVTGITGASAGQ
ncbi:MAG: hypothetical protein IKD58_03755 [Loktanella sp.]|nr:hypothetical protein [Loktanella sp.]